MQSTTSKPKELLVVRKQSSPEVYDTEMEQHLIIILPTSSAELPVAVHG